MLLERIGAALKCTSIDGRVRPEHRLAADARVEQRRARRTEERPHERHHAAAQSRSPQRELIDEYFIEHRTQLLEIAAFLDRLDRAGELDADDDFRVRAFREALPRCSTATAGPRERVQMILSDPRTEPLEELDGRARAAPTTAGSWEAAWSTSTCTRTWSRAPPTTTSDGAHRLRRGHRAGVLGRLRPRSASTASTTTSASSPTSSRSAPRTYGIAHYTWLCLNPKEAEDRELAREVLARHPALPRAAERARHRRDRPQPRHAQRARDLQGPRRPRDRARAADPHPHAAPRGQVQGHARRSSTRSPPTSGSSRRG